MSVLRQRRGESFTVVPNSSVNDPRLTLRAKGLHVVLLSKPDHWNFSSDRVAKECKEGRDAVRSAMRELKDAGYVTEEQRQDDLGRWSTVLEVSDMSLSPAPENPSSVRPATTQLPTPENPTTGSPTVGGSGVLVRTEQQGLSSKKKSKNRPAAPDMDDLECFGGLPAEPELPAPRKIVVRKQGSRNPALLAEVFECRASLAGHGDPRSITLGSALTKQFMAWRDDKGIALDDVALAIDLFFATDHYKREGIPFWKTFISNITALLEKVNHAGDAELTDEEWEAKAARTTKIDPSTLSDEDWMAYQLGTYPDWCGVIEPNYELGNTWQRGWVNSSGLPADLIGIRLKGLQKAWDAEMWGEVVAWFQHYRSGQRPVGQGLLLHGRPGRGKSTLAAALLQEATLRATQRLDHRPEKGEGARAPIAFVPYARLLSMTQQSMRANATGEWDEDMISQQNRLEEIQGLHRNPKNNVRLLVLDDLGKEHSTDSRWAEDSFDLLLRTREAAGWPTIVTTNVPPEKWGASYGESMGSFLHQAFRPVLVRTKRDLRVAG